MVEVYQAEPAAPLYASILFAHGYDNTVRWTPGQDMFDLFESRCDALEATGDLDHPALEVGGCVLSYGQLRDLVDQYATVLANHGVAFGDRVGLLLDRSVESYCAMLAAVRLGATYVPMDLKFPADRIRFIAEDAALKSFICSDRTFDLSCLCDIPVLLTDELAAQVRTVGKNITPLIRRADNAGSDGAPSDPLAYIIYTSGSTGRPKGVAIQQSSICNFIAVAQDVYDYRQSDRVYQGLTFAFDFSVEEFWIPLIAGATLVASPSDVQLVGRALTSFLNDNRITALCCVPTLLATVDEDVPSLRFIMASGEACPQDLVARWHRSDRRLLNAYGPTEATVTATWTELEPDRKVTIGIPLPTYSIAIVDPDTGTLVAPGEVGEIVIGGIGLAAGYLNRESLTQEKFISDFLNMPYNPSGRLYRTGDLGRIDDDGEVEFLGRIDTQVKLKGYRIELGEIEDALLQIDDIAQAVVTLHEDGTTGQKDLVAYITTFENGPGVSREFIVESLRAQLPAYMVPAFIEPVDEIPLLPSQKADRKALPAPRLPRVGGSAGRFVEASSETERAIIACLEGLLDRSRISVADDFFEHLGLDSLRAAEFVLMLEDALPDHTGAIANIYRASCVRDLAALIDAEPKSAARRETVEDAHVASTLSHVLCGSFQGLTYLVLGAGYLWLTLAGLQWVAAAESMGAAFINALTFVAAAFAGFTIVPIATKWLVIGRWRARKIPIWSAEYFQFWFVRLIVESSPLAQFRGSPLFNLYLRLLGARVGENALLLVKTFPLCTDLISIGAGTVLRKESFLSGYRAENGYMLMGPIDVGENVTVGEGALVDIHTHMGNDSQLGHASALLSGQFIADGVRAHGSPAQDCESDFRHPHEHRPTQRQIALFAVFQVALSILGAALLLTLLSLPFGYLTTPARTTELLSSNVLSLNSLGLLASGMAVLFVGMIALSLTIHTVLPRFLTAAFKAGVSYPLYGVRYLTARALVGFANVRMFQILFGDSSFAVTYMRALGVQQPGLQQTGSNFGTELKQDVPPACEIGAGTMVSDGLTISNFDYSAGSFQLSEVKLGEKIFLGNDIQYSARSRVGNNCLLGSKVMLPIDGPVRENVGLLGSPCFEIPRQTQSDMQFDPVPRDTEGRARLHRKNGHNLRSMALYLACNWLALFAGVAAFVSVLVTFGAVHFFSLLAASSAFAMAASILYIMQERLSVLEKLAQPHACTIHDTFFWQIERHWKLCMTPLRMAFRGTPFRPLLNRLQGLQIGRRVFDDGAAITEKMLTSIGDDACLNLQTTIQAHSLEDGLFKSGRITIGARSTIGPMSFVHYGVSMADNTVLAPDAFLMKGSVTENNAVWAGNPAAARIYVDV